MKITLIFLIILNLLYKYHFQFQGTIQIIKNGKVETIKFNNEKEYNKFLSQQNNFLSFKQKQFEVPEKYISYGINKNSKTPPSKYVSPIGEKKSQELTDSFLENFRQEALKQHNSYRNMHRAPSLNRDYELDNIAQEYANRLAKQCSGIVHSNNGKGENLYFSYNKLPTGNEVVTEFYNEIKYYIFGANNLGSSNFSRIGHFTQVVWTETKKLGSGIQKCGDKYYVVMNYFPPGNVIGKEKSCVLNK